MGVRFYMLLQAGKLFMKNLFLNKVFLASNKNCVNFCRAMCGLCGRAHGTQNIVVIANDLQFAQNPFSLQLDCL